MTEPQEPTEIYRYTECCGVLIVSDHRFCPKCGWEARLLAAASRPVSEGPRPELRALIAQWRKEAAITESWWRARALEQCAAAVEAALAVPL